MSACAQNNQSNPEETLDNFFALVKEMEFEESYEFMYSSLQYDFEEKISENLDKNLPDKIENFKSYQEYTVEVAKLYKKIDYEIINNPPDNEKNIREYRVRVTVPDTSEITAKAAIHYMGSLFGALFDEENDSQSYDHIDDLYTDLVEDLKNEEIGEEITEGIITIGLYEDNIDSNKLTWLISEMDDDIFNALTPGW